MKGYTLENFSAYATTVNVDLTAWGAPTDTKWIMRWADRSAQVFHVKIPQPQAPQTIEAIRQMCEKLGRDGFRRIWLPLPTPQDPDRAPLEAAGFQESGKYINNILDLADLPPFPSNPKIRLAPWALSAETFREIYERSRLRSPHTMEGMDGSMVLATYLEEGLLSARNLNAIYLADEVLGAVALNSFSMQGKKIGLFNLFIPRETLKDGRAKEVLCHLLRRYQDDGTERVFLGGKEGDDFLSLQEELGFKTSRPYVHLLKHLDNDHASSPGPAAAGASVS